MLSLKTTCLRSSTTLLAVLALVAFPAALHAQTEEESAATTETPSILLQYGSEVSAGNIITLTRTPVVAANGAIAYWDISIPVTIGSNGKPTVASGATTATPSLSLPVGPIEVGTYVGGVGYTGYGILITGPGVDVGGSTYTVQAAATYNAGSPGISVFWSGGITNNPYITPARFAKAGITGSTGWTFGVVNVTSGVSGGWYDGDIIGFKMVDNGLLIGDFSSGGPDQNTPYHTFLYDYLK
jgi:hypothetical protein